MSEIKTKLEEINYFEDSEKTVEVLESLRELLGAIFIQGQRNYDMLMIIADKLGADANKLLKMHELGEVLAPAPSFKFDELD